MLRREGLWMEDGGEDERMGEGVGDAACNMRYAAMAPLHLHLHTPMDIPPRRIFQMMQLQRGLGGDMASVRCGVGPVELRHQCSGQYGVVVPRIWV